MQPVAKLSVLFIAMAVGMPTLSSAAPIFVNSVTVAGNATDLTPLGGGAGGANVNRLGGFGSDVYYDRVSNSYYGLVDRGPGGGTIGYDTRVQNFSLNVDSTTGSISGFNVLNTTIFKQADGTPFNGFSPDLDPQNANKAVLGRSQDPEGFVLGKNGNYFVSDEYGPSVREFNRDGTLVRTFTTPANLIPRDAANAPDFADGRPTIVTGRQDNRGFEGLTISPDGSKLYGVLQDPLVNEGAQNDGRRSQNVRIVEFDTATGQAGKQVIYQLESLAAINARIPGTANDFSATAQGRNIGVSSITALNDHQFLVLERDNRGLGVGDTTGNNPPVSSKRVYLIDINGATDVSGVSLANSNNLPGGVTPVSKSLYLDIQAALQAAGLTVPEKIEGITIGPQLADGSYEIILGTDNDFSVTQNSSNTQFDVCTGGAQVALDTACPTGQTLIPSFLYAFRDNTLNFTPQLRVPEPGTLALLLMGVVAWVGRGRRRAVKLSAVI